MTDAEPRLRAMTLAEFDAWLPRQVAAYAAQIAASGEMPADAARHKAERDTVRRFRRGFVTPGQLVFRIVAGQVPVGCLWRCPRAGSRPADGMGIRGRDRGRLPRPRLRAGRDAAR